jgi:hypothetical protein
MTCRYTNGIITMRNCKDKGLPHSYCVQSRMSVTKVWRETREHASMWILEQRHKCSYGSRYLSFSDRFLATDFTLVSWLAYFDPTIGEHMLLRNADWVSMDYATLHPRRQNSSHTLWCSMFRLFTFVYKFQGFKSFQHPWKRQLSIYQRTLQRWN